MDNLFSSHFVIFLPAIKLLKRYINMKPCLDGRNYLCTDCNQLFYCKQQIESLNWIYATFVRTSRQNRFLYTYLSSRSRNIQWLIFGMWISQFYIQLVFKAPLCITLTISDQKIVSGSLFFQLFSTFSKKKIIKAILCNFSMRLLKCF